MKNIIIILFTVVLAIYLGSTLLLGEGGSGNSVKDGADTIIEKTITNIDNMDDTVGN